MFINNRKKCTAKGGNIDNMRDDWRLEYHDAVTLSSFIKTHSVRHATYYFFAIFKD